MRRSKRHISGTYGADAKAITMNAGTFEVMPARSVQLSGRIQPKRRQS